MSILAWIVFGVIVGALARLFMPGKQSMGFFLTAGLGILGSVVGGLLVWAFRGAPTGYYDPAGWVMSILGAVIVLGIYGATQRRRLV